MDKQQEQTKQNPNQEVEYISGFLEEEVVNESEFDEPTGEQEVSKLADNQQKEQNKPKTEEKAKKIKRPRKTIEQELAELDAKRERLMEKKRRQDAHEKIVFGAVTIKALRNALNSTNRKMAAGKIIEGILEITNEQEKTIIEKILNKIKN